MSRTPVLALTALSAFLVVLPLTAHKPGTPPTLKADEPAYFLAALSLAHDFDLRFDAADRLRAFESYPYLRVDNTIVMSDDGWRSLYFGKPYLYSLFAAPLARLWGANGMVLLNMLMLVAMIWMATTYLRRYNEEWLAVLFASGFFLLSTAFTYVFWLHPEIFNMFATAACLFFGLEIGAGRSTADTSGATHRRWGLRARLFAGPWALAISAVALAAGVYNKPMLAAMGLPVVFRLLRRRRFADFGVWLLAAAAAVGLWAGLSWVWTGKPSAYLVALRGGFTMQDVERPLVPPQAPPPPPAADGGVGGEVEEDRPKGAGWWWIFRVPETKLFELREDVVYFFVGRHTGLFIYQPFSLLALGLFFAFGRRDPVRWVVFGSVALVAAFFLVFIPFNWHGGGGFVGNRYFIMVYPALIYLVAHIRPAWLLVPAFAVASWLVGPLLLTPYGAPVPFPTLQAHARNHPFEHLPIELSLGEVPGYAGAVQADTWLWGRKDEVRQVAEELWLQGGSETELFLMATEPVDAAVFEVRSPRPGNRTVLALADARTEQVLGLEPLRVTLEPTAPTRIRRDRLRHSYFEFHDIYVYRLAVTTELGEVPAWRGERGPRFYLGAALRYLGPPADAGPRVEPATVAE